MSYLNRIPVATENTIDHLPIQGRIPAGLAGTLYRNGPNPLASDPASHWFLGHGMVHAFHIADGTVAYRNRWVRTQHWAAATGSPQEDLPDGAANTSILSLAGQVLALEEAHLPVVLDPASLATLGAQDFAGALPPGPFTAHPKTCPATGNLVFFGYGVGGMLSDTIRLGEITPSGELLHLDTVTAPYGAMIHDFAVTERFIAIPLFPLVLNDTHNGVVWQPNRGCFLGLIDRTKGVASLRWLPVASGFAFHIANAWDEDGALLIDLMRADAPPFFPTEDGQPASTNAFPTRWRIEPGAASITVTTLSTTEGEFPRIDERWAGRRNRHLFFSTGASLCARDDLTGAETLFAPPDGDSISEPVFVPGGDAEAEGWLLAIATSAATQTSALVILDAQDLAAGPIATARLPVRVPAGFHGAWVGDAS